MASACSTTVFGPVLHALSVCCLIIGNGVLWINGHIAQTLCAVIFTTFSHEEISGWEKFMK